ncbi:restriction endonuclease subunit S [Pantoea dispersa]|uniref:restriction endonuclease subunit S n=1 Tax=Pantoea dispersa TaxID=59814 RepID=UPI0007375CE8|nr:restriction endonuclease subunit S [Pantoea dispersa]KTS01747.1 restriction endonuclease EcoKI subunit S [Pantoea dispersa]
MSAGIVPEGWVPCKLGDTLLKIVGGGTPSKAIPEYYRGDIPWMSVKDMNKHTLIDTVDHITPDAVKNSSTNIIPAGIPIIATRMSLGKVVIASFDSAINQDLKALFLANGIERNFFLHWYRAQAQLIESLGTGTTVKGIRLEVLYSLAMDLPPLAEQKIIAEKLDTLLAQVDSTKARLEKIPKILKRFRQSVLTSAVNGILTEEWRNSFHELSGFKKIKFESILTELRNGLSSKPNENGLGHPILRISSVRSGHVEQSDIRYLECTDVELERHKLIKDDLLFTRYNGSLEFVGVCGILKKPLYKDLVYPDKLIRARLTKDALPKYIEIFFSSPYARSAMMACVKTTSGQKGISGKDIRSQLVNLPSLKEQHEIVRRVEQLFAYADTIEKQVNNALSRVNNLTQSILAKAFRGELTAQWRAENPELISGDNSAAALLEKIKAERAASTGKKATRKKS